MWQIMKVKFVRNAFGSNRIVVFNDNLCLLDKGGYVLSLEIEEWGKDLRLDVFDMKCDGIKTVCIEDYPPVLFDYDRFMNERNEALFLLQKK